MINCQYLNYNEKTVFGTMINEKDEPAQSTLLNIANRVFNSYDQYLNQFTTLQSKSRSEFLLSEIDERAALKLCYSSASATFKFVRGKIFSSQCNQLKSFCPYCLLDKPKTLDHYLGQTEFPEYSTLIKNLVPCCYDCNQLKRENWRKYGRRRFIHFYNDLFLQRRFLHARLIYPRRQRTPQISYYLTKHSLMSMDDFRIVKTHFKDLRLLTSYADRANALLSSEIDVLEKAVNRGNSRAEIKDGLLQKYNSLANDFGPNYWSAVMYETMSNNNRLIRSL